MLFNWKPGVVIPRVVPVCRVENRIRKVSKPHFRYSPGRIFLPRRSLLAPRKGSRRLAPHLVDG